MDYQTKTKEELISIIEDLQKANERLKTYAEKTGTGKQCMENLSHGQVNYNTIFENVQDVCYQVNLSGKILEISPSIKSFLGFEREEMIGFSVNYLYNDPGDKWKLLQTILKKGELRDFEVQVQTKSGETKYASINARLIIDESGKPRCIAGSLRDITLRKDSESKLTETYEQLRSLIEAIPDAIFFKDGEGRWLVTNETAKKLFKLQNYDWKGKTDAQLGEERPELKEAHDACIISDEKAWQAGKLVLNSEEILDEQGLLHHFEVRKMPVFAQDGDRRALVVVGSDVTQRKNAEKALSVSEEKYRLIAENTSDGILIINANTKVIYVSPSYLRQIGYSEAEELSRDANSIYSIIHPEDRDKLFKDIFEAIELKKTHLTYNYRVQHKDGHYIYREDNAQFNYDSSGNHLNTYVICRDISERKQADEKIQKIANHYQAIIDKAPDGIVLINAEGRLKFVSPAALKIFGYQLSDLLDSNPSDFTHPEDLPLVLSNLSKLIQDPAHIPTLQYRFIDKNGKWRWVESTMTNLFSDPNVESIVINFRDITERKLSEQIAQIHYNITNALLKTKNLNELMEIVLTELQAIISTSNFYIALYDEKTDTLSAPFVSDKNDKISKWPASKSLTGIVVRKNKTLLLKNKEEIAHIFKTGEAEMIGFPASCWLGVPLNIKEKTIGAFVAQSYEHENIYSESDVVLIEYISQNISMAIKRLKDEKQINLLAKSIEQSPVTVVITDKKGNIEYANPVFTKVTGYAIDEIQGENPRFLNSGFQTKEFYENLWNTILSGKNWFGEFRNKKENGELFWESAIISPLADSDGEITSFIAIKEDITEKKKMIEDLIEAKEKAEESNKLKTAFLNNISHEIRTPFNGILGFLNIIQEDELTTEKRDEYFDRINDSADRLMKTINDIVEISQIQAGQIKIDFTVTNLHKISSELLTSFLPIARRKALELNANFNLSNDIAFITTDKTKLDSILSILIDNAIKFTNTGSIEFGYKPIAAEVENETGKPTTLEFYVKDSGIGIPAYKQQIVFDRFIQADVSNTRRYEGSGLGLSIAKSYVEMLGGKIWVESEEGMGSTFYFTLTDHKTLTPEISLKTPEKKTVPEMKKLKILIADDDESSVILLETILIPISYEILTTNTGNGAVEICRKNPDIDLIMMDIKLPNLSGYKATAQIREFNQKVFIIAQTAFALSGDREKALAAGCNEYLAKPFKKDELMKIIRNMPID